MQPAGLLIVSLFLATASFSQDRPATDSTARKGILSMEDTVVLSDETTETIEEEDYYEEDEYEETTSHEYFIPWKFGRDANDSLRLRHLPDSLQAAWRHDKAYSYADSNLSNAVLETYQGNQRAKAKRMTTGAGWLQPLLWLLIAAGFIGFLYLLLRDGGLFRKKSAALDEQEPDDSLTEDIFAINYQREIDKAVSAGNYRIAVRLMFLRLLKNMAEKNIIRYRQDNTNHDYLLQLNGHRHYDSFFRITRNYEYSWYGQFEVQEKAYRHIKRDFEELERKL